MSVKMINKEEIEYRNGYLVNGDEIIVVDHKVVEQANKLDVLKQALAYYTNHGGEKREIGADMDNFKPATEYIKPKFDVDTPIMDKQVEDAFKLMEEIDDIDTVNEANNALSGMSELIEFVMSDSVISCDGVPKRFDLPLFKSPLDITIDDITNIILDAARAEIG